MAKVTLTKAQWADMAAVLDRGYPWPLYVLRVDGYKITLHPGVHKRKVTISVCVNDWFKGKWFSRDAEGEDLEIARRFFPLVKVRGVKASHYQLLVKAYGKKWAREHPNWTEIRAPSYTSARQLRLHLERNNEHIELIEPAAAEAATDA